MAKDPDLIPIKSSMMQGYFHDPDTRELHIEFRPGSRYVYEDVPIEKVEAMKGAASPGGYFAAKIRNQHKARKI